MKRPGVGCGSSGPAGVHTQEQWRRMSQAYMSFRVFLLGLPPIGEKANGYIYIKL